MIINKISEIINIGSFKNFIEKNIIYGKVNVFYALNGYGKTTLTSVIRSLKDNNPELIFGRKNLKETNNNKLQAKIESADSKNYLFTNGTWRVGGQQITNKNPEIVIFDDEFVSNNIFAEKFEIDHKKALYRIIFGVEGIKLSKELTELREKKKILDDELSSLQNKLLPKIYPKNKYIALNESSFDIPKIKIELQEIEKKINNNTNIAKITKKQELNTLQYFEFNQNKFFSILKRKVNSEAHLTAKSEIDKFKIEFFKNPSEFENFIKIGNDNYENSCPFCHKILDDNVLLDTYENYFDKSYEEFKNLLQSQIKQFNSLNFRSFIDNLNSIIERNIEIYEEWKELFKICETLQSIGFTEEIINFKKQIDEFNTNKLLNLNIEPDTLLLIDFKKHKILINWTTRKYNKQINKINEEITKFKQSLSITNLTDLENKVKKNNDIINRFSVEIKTLCNKINDKTLEIKTNKENIDKKVNELKIYSRNINAEYLVTINDILKNELFISDFKLNSISEESNAKTKDAYVEIYFEMLNQKIALNSYKDEIPSFKNTLSRGDKNTLAFAFFLAFMRKKQGLENVCLIFDDPLSSHDENRQTQTALTIMKLANQVSQTFVFTHQKSFLRAMFDKFNDSAKYFEINKTDLVGSSIKQMDKIKITYRTEFELIIDKFSKYLIDNTNSDLSIGNLKNDIRKVLENVIKTKYYNKLKDCSFSITSYSHLDEYFFTTGIIVNNEKIELIDLAQISNSGSHLKNYEDMNTEEIKTVIQRTLNLIERL